MLRFFHVITVLLICVVDIVVNLVVVDDFFHDAKNGLILSLCSSCWFAIFTVELAARVTVSEMLVITFRALGMWPARRVFY